jgi:hypothetical protein
MPKLTKILFGAAAALLTDAIICPLVNGGPSIRSYFGLETERYDINNLIKTGEQAALILYAAIYGIVYSTSNKNKSEENQTEGYIA